MINYAELSSRSRISGKTVSGGWYTKHYTVLGEPEQGGDIVPPADPGLSLNDCLLACDLRLTCSLVYYDSTAPVRKCVLKSGQLAEPLSLYRTVIRGVGSRLVQTQLADGSACVSDGDCLSGRCNLQNGTCTAMHCLDLLWNADETGRDCGGSDCPACPGKMLQHVLGC
jgi:hypothetical protein